MLVNAHDDGSILTVVELAHAEEALLLDLVGDERLDFGVHELRTDQFHPLNL